MTEEMIITTTVRFSAPVTAEFAQHVFDAIGMSIERAYAEGAITPDDNDEIEVSIRLTTDTLNYAIPEVQ
jgi:hypothetical protein